MKSLHRDKGYALDTRPPRWDPIAVEVSNLVFGKDTVTSILEKYKRSAVTLEALTEDVMEYDIKRAPRVKDDPIYISALQSVREQFTPQVPLIPTTLGAVNTRSGIPKDKSPGLPWKELGFKTKAEVMNNPEAMKLIRSKWMVIGRGYPSTLPDCLVYARAQICASDKNKIRATWGYPTEVYLEEARYVYPYLDFLKKRNDDYPLAYGIEMGKGGMGYINEMYERSPKGSAAYMLDWKRFDKHVPAWLIRDAFDILWNSFDHDKVVDSEDIIWEVNPELTKNRWAKIVNYFINTPFRLPSGERFRKDGGVPSGSGFTNIIDSIVNAIVTRYCAYQVCGSFPLYDMYMGDDSVLMSLNPINIEQFALVASDTFGFVLNLDKSYATTKLTNIQFLGYFNDHGYPIRDMDFLIASFMLPERVNEPDPLFTAARAVGQMWSTFNAEAAGLWLVVIQVLEKMHHLDADWFRQHMIEKPNALKFLRLHGLEPLDFPTPSLFNDITAPMVPPNTSIKRKPSRRITTAQDLYWRYIDDPMKEGTSREHDPP